MSDLPPFLMCTMCKLPKTPHAFSNNKARSNGKNTACKSCMKDYQKKWREEIRQSKPVHVSSKGCSGCKKNLSAEFFHRSYTTKSGLGNQCKACSRAYTAKSYRTPEGWKRSILSSAKRRSALRGMEFNLTPDDLVVPTHCPVLGIPLEIADGIKTDNSPTVDRLNNSKGYLRGNVAVISWRANKIKADATLDELRSLVKYMEQFE